MSQLHVDNIMNYAITAADAAGDPISPITFDAPPVWTSSNPAAGAIVASADGTTAVLTPAAAPGSVGQVTTVTMTCSIAGTSFSATDSVTIVAGAVASVSIVGTPAPIPAPAPAPAPGP